MLCTRCHQSVSYQKMAYHEETRRGGASANGTDHTQLIITANQSTQRTKLKSKNKLERERWRSSTVRRMYVRSERFNTVLEPGPCQKRPDFERIFSRVRRAVPSWFVVVVVHEHKSVTSARSIGERHTPILALSREHAKFRGSCTWAAAKNGTASNSSRHLPSPSISRSVGRPAGLPRILDDVGLHDRAGYVWEERNPPFVPQKK